MQHFDAIVLGVGGVGSAALCQLARRGLRVLGLDRFAPGHDRGSSHGATRIIRRAYSEHPDYVPLVLRAYQAWAELSQWRGRRLCHEVGLLSIGPRQGEVLPGILNSARRHGLPLEELSPAEAMERWPGFRVSDDWFCLFEKQAGYLLVEECVWAHVDEALRAGAVLHAGSVVHCWRALGAGVEVETDQATYSAGRLIIAAGPWAAGLLSDLGLRLEVRRKPVFWYEASDGTYLAEHGCPCYMYELPLGVFYGFPQIDSWGVKVAEHTGGAVIDDPLAVNRDIDPAERDRIEAFVSGQLPSVRCRLNRHSVCMYTMTPDAHFVVDRHPLHPQVAFAAGLSGHGFKFTPVLGEALADLAMEGRTSIPIEFLSCSRTGQAGRVQGR